MNGSNSPSEAARKAVIEEREDLDESSQGLVGAVLDDQGRIITLPSVEHTFRDCDMWFGYPPVDGFGTYREEVTSWILEGDIASAQSNHGLLSFASVGGSGGLYLAFRLAQELGYEILYPQLGRDCYPDLCDGAFAYAKSYPAFGEDGLLDTAGIHDIIAEDKGNFRGFLLVINDPCQSPTGHTLSREESDALIDMVTRTNRLEGTRVAIVWDTSYLSFAASRPTWLSRICGSDVQFTNILVFSASKCFCIYGLRLGMLLCLTSRATPEVTDLIYNTFARVVRQTYRVPDGLGMAAVEKLISPENVERVRSEIAPIGNLLRERGARAMSALKSKGVDYIPYTEGFYLTATVRKDPEKIQNESEKRGLPVKAILPRYARISLASLRPGQEDEIADLISKFDN